MTHMNGLDDLGLAVPYLRISLHSPAGVREPAYTRLSLPQRRKTDTTERLSLSLRGRNALSLSVWMLLKSPTGHSYPAPLPSCGSHPRHLLPLPSFDPWASP